MRLKKNRWTVVAVITTQNEDGEKETARMPLLRSHTKARAFKRARQWAVEAKAALEAQGRLLPDISFELYRTPRKPVDLGELRLLNGTPVSARDRRKAQGPKTGPIGPLGPSDRQKDRAQARRADVIARSPRRKKRAWEVLRAMEAKIRQSTNFQIVPEVPK